MDQDVQVCYWSSGWGGYNLASATTLNNAGFELINTNQGYYWVLGQRRLAGQREEGWRV